MPPRKIRVLLELEPGTEPITGVLQHPPNGTLKPFTGWLQLTQLLETIRRSPDKRSPDKGHGSAAKR